MKKKLALVASLVALVALAVACGDSSNGELEGLRAENERLLSEAQELRSAAEQQVLAPSPAATSTSTPAPTTPTSTPTPTEPVPEPSSEPTPLLLVELLSPPVERYIGDTGGGGVSIRSRCAESARAPGAWAEGVPILVTGSGINECAGWITAESNGVESWVSDRYVVSAPSRTAAATDLRNAKFVSGFIDGCTRPDGSNRVSCACVAEYVVASATEADWELASEGDGSAIEALAQKALDDCNRVAASVARPMPSGPVGSDLVSACVYFADLMDYALDRAEARDTTELAWIDLEFGALYGGDALGTASIHAQLLIKYTIQGLIYAKNGNSGMTRANFDLAQTEVETAIAYAQAACGG